MILLKKLIIIFYILLFINQLLIADKLPDYEVYFYPDSDKIIKKSLKTLDEINELLKNNKEYIITLKGYTNSVGESEEELKLSKKRSNKIALYLKNKNISLNRIKTEGYGSENLKIDKISGKNRRVEIYIYKKRNDFKSKENSKKIKITVLNKKEENINVKLEVKQIKNNKVIYKNSYKFNKPTVIDIPDKGKIEFFFTSEGYMTKKIIIKKNEEEKIVYMDIIDPNDPIIGEWEWFVNGNVIVNADGTFEQVSTKGKGFWVKNGTVSYIFYWQYKYIDKMILTDGKYLNGVNNENFSVWAKKVE